MRYIIEFEDEYSMNEAGMKYHQCKQVPYWSVSHGIIKNLTPYIEPDRKAIEDEVWEFVRTITDMTNTQRIQCFGSETCDLDDYLTYQEAKSKYEAWNKWKKQKYEIHVGDEVEYGDCKFVVTAETESRYHGIHSSNGNIVRFGEGDYCRKDNCKKTGRHFDEVAELLEKMRGNEEE